MDSEKTKGVVVPLVEPRLERGGEAMDRLAGDDPKSIGESSSAPSLVDESWLDELADGLAGTAWVECDLGARLPSGLLSELKREVEILDKTEAMTRAGIGRGIDLLKDRSVRRDKIVWMDGASAPQAELFRFFDQVRDGLNRRLFLGLKRYEAHYSTYQPGDFYKRHVDSFKGRASRMISLVLYLNDNWGLEDGGELRVFDVVDQESPVGLLRPETGRAAFFLSESVPHEVLPARRTRYSIACWFRQDEVPLPL
ncbi:2OG-Fe(II) oxygenase superfamily protein [Marinobacter litoralis]|uniref:2OG-Fe(II) oxygenase superfamily protein n=1 Tax=Marinobacter litoralis TaxID=187981 RepID=A0A3M2RLS3_9GAMM|nr:2OG-Fe(II) oxygenase [Marinobacter litoralis]RMJ06154.1 2OG-Fe(II) oxygenase superfamily protein [Marinobacter litoralis]